MRTEAFIPKVVFVGQAGQGKSTLIHRLHHNEFTERIPSTVGGCFAALTRLRDDGTEIKLGLWDTAGEERYHSMIPVFLRGSSIACVCISPCNTVDDLQTADMYVKMVIEHSKDASIIVVLTKYDLMGVQIRSTLEMENYCRTRGYPCIRTSSKSGLGINELLREMFGRLDIRPKLEPDIVDIESQPLTSKLACCK